MLRLRHAGSHDMATTYTHIAANKRKTAMLNAVLNSGVA